MGSAKRPMKRNMKRYTEATGIGFANAGQVLRPGMPVILLRRDMPTRLPPDIGLTELALYWGEFGIVLRRADDTVDVRMVSDSGKPTGETRRVSIEEIFATYSGKGHEP